MAFFAELRADCIFNNVSPSTESPDVGIQGSGWIRWISTRKAQAMNLPSFKKGSNIIKRFESFCRIPFSSILFRQINSVLDQHRTRLEPLFSPRSGPSRLSAAGVGYFLGNRSIIIARKTIPIQNQAQHDIRRLIAINTFSPSPSPQSSGDHNRRPTWSFGYPRHRQWLGAILLWSIPTTGDPKHKPLLSSFSAPNPGLVKGIQEVTE